MTGYGRGAAARDGVRVEVELKGVNHRFLDLKLKLPVELLASEAELRSRVQRAVGRARVDVVVSLATARAAAPQIEINRPLVMEYLRAAAALKKEFRLRGSIPLESVWSLPGALSIRGDAAVDDGLASGLAGEALEKALAAYDVMRTEEGARLAADMISRLDAIAREAAGIEETSRGHPDAYARRLSERIGSMAREHALDEARLAQEVAILAGKVDITEELVRLKGYVHQARSALETSAEPIGKTLDFVMQEMTREANTISSKSESLDICQAALRIKSEVEKIREQVQNLE